MIKYAIRLLHTDAICYEIVRYVSEKTMEVRKMKQEITNKSEILKTFTPCGFSGHVCDDNQKWIFSPDPTEKIERIRLTKKGWHHKELGKFALSEIAWANYDFNF